MVKLLDRNEAEAYLGHKKSGWSLLQLAKQGKIPHVRIGRRVFFRQEALDQWILELEAASVKPQEEEGQQYGKLRKIYG